MEFLFKIYIFNTFDVSQIFRHRVVQARFKHSYCISLKGCAGFLFVGYIHSVPCNGWFLATVSGCDQLVVGPTHARGRTFHLLMTDVPDLVQVAFVAPIGNSDHSSLSAVISMAQAVPNLCVSRKVFLKHQVNWNTVCGAIRKLPWRNIGFLTILLKF